MANNEYLVQVEHLKEYFPVRAGFGRTDARSRRSITSPSASARARPSALSANPAAARPPVGRTLLQLYKPTGGRIIFDGQVIYDSGEQYDENGRLKVDANGKAHPGQEGPGLTCCPTASRCRWSSRTRTPRSTRA